MLTWRKKYREIKNEFGKTCFCSVTRTTATGPSRTDGHGACTIQNFTYVIVFDVLDEIIKIFETKTAVVEFTFV